MSNILFYGGSSLLAYLWYSQIIDKSKVFLTQHKKEIKIKDAQIIKVNNTNFEIVNNLIKDYKIKILINCVGLTNVENCESNKNLSNYLNAEIPLILAKACKLNNIKFVHISTDHLFDGSKSYYKETDLTSPLNEYAKSKLKGEINTIKSNPNSLVIRTNFFGNGPNYKNSFSDLIINGLRNDSRLELFEDVMYTPIIINELVRIVDLLIKSNHFGIFNVASSERISKYEFGLLLSKNLCFSSQNILKSKIENRLDLTKRPRDMSLSNELIKKLNISILNIEDQIKLLKKNDTV